MTDRYDAFLVVLDHAIRDDDAEATIAAIKQIKGVLDVQPHTMNPLTAIAKLQIKAHLLENLPRLLLEEIEDA